MLRLQAGDSQAFADAHAQLEAVIASAAARELGDHHDIEDVVQDVFARVEVIAAQFDPSRGSAAALLATVARNRALDIRRDRLRTVAEDAHAILERSGEMAARDSGAMDRAGLVERLGELPVLAREVMWLRYVLDLPLAEIARNLGREHAHVRQVHRRALLALAAAC
jgi:RNA polymerase sigma-70 factor (ECF subfamily)